MTLSVHKDAWLDWDFPDTLFLPLSTGACWLLTGCIVLYLVALSAISAHSSNSIGRWVGQMGAQLTSVSVNHYLLEDLPTGVFTRLSIRVVQQFLAAKLGPLKCSWWSHKGESVYVLTTDLTLKLVSYSEKCSLYIKARHCLFSLTTHCGCRKTPGIYMVLTKWYGYCLVRLYLPRIYSSLGLGKRALAVGSSKTTAFAFWNRKGTNVLFQCPLFGLLLTFLMSVLPIMLV